MMSGGSIMYVRLAELFDPQRKYAGYKPDVREIPNGDRMVDVNKRYLHIAPKYSPPSWAMGAYFELWMRAGEYARDNGHPHVSFDHSALRVLDYPPGAGSEHHTDFDMFTINAYRNIQLPDWPEVHVVRLSCEASDVR